MDIALQHISDNMLEKMRRHVTKEDTYRLIEKFREEVPGIHLRTTLMVGHPGETEADFEELKEFVRKVRFDRMGGICIFRGGRYVCRCPLRRQHSSRSKASPVG